MSDYYDLPFKDILDWRKFSIILEESQVYYLREHLKEMLEHEYRAMQTNTVMVHFFFVSHQPSTPIFCEIFSWKCFWRLVSFILLSLNVLNLHCLLPDCFSSLHLNQVRKHFQWNLVPAKYDAFHMTMYDLWLRNHFTKYYWLSCCNFRSIKMNLNSLSTQFLKYWHICDVYHSNCFCISQILTYDMPLLLLFKSVSDKFFSQNIVLVSTRQKVVSTKVKFSSFDEILNVPWGFRSRLWGNGEELQDERTFAFPTESSSSQTWCISYDHVWQSLLKLSCHKDEPLPFQFSEKCCVRITQISSIVLRCCV